MRSSVFRFQSIVLVADGNAALLDVLVTEPTLTPEERSVRGTQSVITAAYSRNSTDDPISGEFRLGAYDKEDPLTSLDFGGDDQEQRYVHPFSF